MIMRRLLNEEGKKSGSTRGVVETEILTEQLEVVKKGSPEFKSTQAEYLKLFFNAKPEDYLKRGVFTQGENAGKFLAATTQKILDAKLPMPFGCPLLCIQPCYDNAPGRKPDQFNKVTGIIWFCDQNGAICVCCREDFTGPQEEYPNYCPTFEVDDCTLHQGDCDGCPSRYNCHPEWDETDEDWWEIEDSEYGFL